MIKICPKRQYEKNVVKISLSLLGAVHLLLDMEPYLGMFYIPCETPLA